MMTSISRIFTIANEITDNYKISEVEVKLGEKYLNSEGLLELVVRVNEDGSFVTEEFNKNTVKAQTIKCSHPVASLVAIAELQPDTRTIATEACCFKYRSVVKCRCQKCGRTVKTYGVWKYHKKHKFPLFGKTCKTCGYKK